MTNSPLPLATKLGMSEAYIGGRRYAVTQLVLASPAELSPGTVLTIQGVTKGKGFQGVVRRWGFAGGSKTHGQSDRHRAPGSIGQGTTPGRVHKGKKMAGRMGGTTHTVRNSLVVAVRDKKLLVTGQVPGHHRSKLHLTFTGTRSLPETIILPGWET